MSDGTQKQIEELKTEVVSLKIRLVRVEQFINDMPTASEYIQKQAHQIHNGDKDDLFEDAVRLVCTQDKVSSSFLQRRLKIGFNRAARLLELLEELGVVKSEEGHTRTVLIKDAGEVLKKLKE